MKLVNVRTRVRDMKYKAGKPWVQLYKVGMKVGYGYQGKVTCLTYIS